MEDKIDLLGIQKVSNGYIVTVNDYRGSEQFSKTTLVFNTADQLCDYIQDKFKA